MTNSVHVSPECSIAKALSVVERKPRVGGPQKAKKSGKFFFLGHSCPVVHTVETSGQSFLPRQDCVAQRYEFSLDGSLVECRQRTTFQL